jgi:hypothetical protein
MLCFGCNLGPSQAARSIKSLTRKQVAYLNLSHVREKDLIKATEKVINAYNEYDRPKFWGTGENASVDGTDLEPQTDEIVRLCRNSCRKAIRFNIL